jgi:hypothetical protein
LHMHIFIVFSSPSLHCLVKNNKIKIAKELITNNSNKNER